MFRIFKRIRELETQVENLKDQIRPLGKYIQELKQSNKCAAGKHEWEWDSGSSRGDGKRCRHCYKFREFKEVEQPLNKE